MDVTAMALLLIGVVVLLVMVVALWIVERPRKSKVKRGIVVARHLEDVTAYHEFPVRPRHQR